MALETQVMEDLKRAMRDKDELARDTLRLLRSELGRAALDKGSPLDEAEAVAVVARQVKTRREAIAQYRDGGRDDLADTEEREIAVLERYLPKALGPDELREAVRAVIAKTGATTKSDLGKVMQAVMAEHRGRIDGKLAKQVAGELLG